MCTGIHTYTNAYKWVLVMDIIYHCGIDVPDMYTDQDIHIH